MYAEKAILCGICQHGKDAWLDCSDLIDVNCFTDEFNGALYKTLDYLCEQDQKVDLPSIISAASSLKLDVVQDKNNRTYIKSLFQTKIELDNVRKFAGKLRKISLANQLTDLVSQAQNELKEVTGDESLDAILDIVESKIFDFSSNLGQKEGEAQHISIGLDDYIERLKTSPVDQVGIPTGFKTYDFAIGGGLRRGCFNLIGARPKIGKSTLCDNIAIHTALKLDVPTLVLDTEMQVDDHWNRILANQTQIVVDEIGSGRIFSDKYLGSKVEKIKEDLNRSNLYYKNISGKPFTEVISVIRRWIYKNVGIEGGKAKDCVIIYDYFKLPESEAKDSKYQEYQLIGFQSAKLHDFAVKYGASILAFVQVNRDGISKDDTSVVSQSDRLIWNCASFSIFRPKSTKDIEADGNHMGNRVLVPIVSRYGREWNIGNYINMQMTGEYALIQELGTREYTEGQTVDFN